MRKYLILCLMLGHSLMAQADNIINKEITDAQLVTTARLSVFVFDIYDASLYTPNGQPTFEPPFALKLSYLRDIDGEDIADRSAEEMRLQNRVDEVTLAAWHSQMRNIFPDVTKGDEIAGVYKNPPQCVFYKNGQYIGEMLEPEFCDVFFDIWFGKNTTAPKLRNQVLKKQQATAVGVR